MIHSRCIFRVLTPLDAFLADDEGVESAATSTPSVLNGSTLGVHFFAPELTEHRSRR
jgi:hypothetical protein